jgi:hypothetical protein
VSDRPLSLSFFDPARRLSGTARAGITLLFDGGSPTTLPESVVVERSSGERVHARIEGRVELDFEAVAEPAELAGAAVTLCAVTGTAEGRELACLGTLTETAEPPEWAELDAMRAISALFDREHAVFVVAKRPHGALGHGHEKVEAKLLLAGELVGVEETRLSTVYDGEGRQRSAGLELWLPGEDFPRRVSGSVQAGASLSLEGLQVNAAVFDWHMEGRAGTGAYELAVRDEGPEAA